MKTQSYRAASDGGPLVRFIELPVFGAAYWLLQTSSKPDRWLTLWLKMRSVVIAQKWHYRADIPHTTWAKS